jgi:hypothetical protein
LATGAFDDVSQMAIGQQYGDNDDDARLDCGRQSLGPFGIFFPLNLSLNLSFSGVEFQAIKD